MSTTGSLYRYRIDYSMLTDGEYEALEKRIENVAFLGLRPNPHTKIGEFYLSCENADDYLKYINVPACCNLHRIG